MNHGPHHHHHKPHSSSAELCTKSPTLRKVMQFLPQSGASARISSRSSMELTHETNKCTCSIFMHWHIMLMFFCETSVIIFAEFLKGENFNPDLMSFPARKNESKSHSRASWDTGDKYGLKKCARFC